MMLTAQALALCHKRKILTYVNLFVVNRSHLHGHFVRLINYIERLYHSTYNKDMQEDKEGIFDAIDTVHFALSINAAMLRGMKVNGGHMKAVLMMTSNATIWLITLRKRRPIP